MTTYSYLDYMKRLSAKFDWKNKEFMLAFDYTDEEISGFMVFSLYELRRSNLFKHRLFSRVIKCLYVSKWG